jgi:hypothetical protein
MFEFLAMVRLSTAVVKASIRCAGVAIAISSWIAISNHCAFAAIATSGTGCQPESHHRQGADATHCPFHSKPAKEKQQTAQMQCCKILRAVVLAQSKTWARNDAKFLSVDIRPHEFALIALQPNARASLPLETGPPDAHSFAELVLQQSLFAHAPPSLG